MQDNIQMNRVGDLADPLVIEITAQSALVHAVSTVHLAVDVIGELQDTIREFLSENDLETYWESDIPGLGEGPSVSLRFLPGDSEECVLVETYLELDDGSDFSRHICCFYVHTTRRCLAAFCQNLNALTAVETAATVALNI